MNIRNLTGEDLTLVNKESGVHMHIQAEALKPVIMMRLRDVHVLEAKYAGVRDTVQEFSKSVGLPDKVKDTLLIVTHDVFDQYPARTDLRVLTCGGTALRRHR